MSEATADPALPPAPPPSASTVLGATEAVNCPGCKAPMQRGHQREHVGWGDYPGTGRLMRVWFCGPCDRVEELPDR